MRHPRRLPLTVKNEEQGAGRGMRRDAVRNRRKLLEEKPNSAVDVRSSSTDGKYR
jgi:hypothetical protein